MFTIFLCMFGIGMIFAQTNWKTKSSTVTFKIKNAGFNMDGFFKGFEGKINFSPDDLANSTMEASVETKTINTNNSMRDKHLRSDDYFGVEKYPKITMKSKRIAKSQSGGYIGYFDLTIRSTTKEIKIPFTFKESGETATFAGSFTINRRDYGVGGSSIILSDNATIALNIVVEK